MSRAGSADSIAPGRLVASGPMKSKEYVRRDPRTKGPTGPVRLQKYLAECGIASRRKAEELIREGKVRVNGEVVTEMGTKITPGKDTVKVGSRAVNLSARGALIFYKPRGVVSTLSDPEGRPCVADYMTRKYRGYYPVGRLDYDSSGLIVLTNDGELAERLMHPRYGFSRIYHVRVEGDPSEAVLRKVEKGVKLRDGMARADVKYLRGDEGSAWLEVTVTEGRNRLVRRIFDEVGHSVIKLRRIQHGPFKLGKLQPGDVRPLTEEEFRKVRRAAFATDA